MISTDLCQPIRSEYYLSGSEEEFVLAKLILVRVSDESGHDVLTRHSVISFLDVFGMTENPGEIFLQSFIWIKSSSPVSNIEVIISPSGRVACC